MIFIGFWSKPQFDDSFKKCPILLQTIKKSFIHLFYLQGINIHLYRYITYVQ